MVPVLLVWQIISSYLCQPDVIHCLHSQRLFILYTADLADVVQQYHVNFQLTPMTTSYIYTVVGTI